MQIPVPTKGPAFIFKRIPTAHAGVRFRQIGAPARFGRIRHRFLDEFPLAEWTEIRGEFWWIIESSQLSDLRDFCQRNHLKLFEEVEGVLHER